MKTSATPYWKLSSDSMIKILGLILHEHMQKKGFVGKQTRTKTFLCIFSECGDVMCGSISRGESAVLNLEKVLEHQTSRATDIYSFL